MTCPDDVALSLSFQYAFWKLILLFSTKYFADLLNQILSLNASTEYFLVPFINLAPLTFEVCDKIVK